LEIPFSSILFEELLHKGTFKVVHHATITHPPLGIRNVHAAVKRLKSAYYVVTSLTWLSVYASIVGLEEFLDKKNGRAELKHSE